MDQKPFAFVLMPFDKDFDDIYKLGIKETAVSLGFVAERVDEQIYAEGILERIYRQIEAADLIIADMSGKNPNVFYEVGYAHAKGKLSVLLTADADDIPFDLKHRRHIVYGQSIARLRTHLSNELRWAKTQLENLRRSHIKTTVQTWGNLTRNQYAATAEVDFTIDLKNESDKSSPDIEVLYFYTTKDWTLFQDGKTCSSTTSDIAPFQRMHFLSCPVRRLQRGGWAQLKFSARKVVAVATLGEELKNTYRLTGRSVLRLVTNEGNFDNELQLDVTAEEFPF
jgi:nucleoside 2-deoxyribosyltransferase